MKNFTAVQAIHYLTVQQNVISTETKNINTPTRLRRTLIIKGAF